MKLFVVFISALVSCQAAPSVISYHPTLYSSLHALPAYQYVAAVPAVSQYHSQDSLGQYSYGYSGGPSAKSEVKTLDGVTRGSYSYIDANAKLQHVDYVADAGGFRVAATNLPVDTNAAPVANGQAPVPVEDTVEVKQARAEHFAAVARAQAEAGSSADDESVVVEAPQQVEDTEEVKQAREEHFAAVEEAKARLQEAPVAPVVVADHVQAPVIAVHSSPLIAQTHLVKSSPIVQYSHVPAPLVTQHVQLAHTPVLLKAAPAKSFAYSVYAPGYSNVVHVA